MDNIDNFTTLVPDFREIPEGDVTVARELWETTKEAERARMNFTAAFDESQKVFDEVLQGPRRPAGSRFTQVEQGAQSAARTPVNDQELSRGMYITQPFRKNPIKLRIYDGEHEAAMLEEARQVAQTVQAAKMAEAVSDEITEMGRHTLEQSKDKAILNEIANLNATLTSRTIAAKKAFHPTTSAFGVAVTVPNKSKGAAGGLDCTPRMRFRQTQNGPIDKDHLAPTAQQQNDDVGQSSDTGGSSANQNSISSIKVVNLFTPTAVDLPAALPRSTVPPVPNGFYGRTKASF
ncbi:hypothetical protein TGMAS_233405 [Toxoplasma gondii MAS]|uniref:Uncharacterized protein n=1 Tax=Toxoplasma gondii MAS TaxID=943118 RepID=A0A086QXA4_TOXGO|nr:hypothetical protein TGMAS_233405 [Toxoplasma gondii MAS]